MRKPFYRWAGMVGLLLAVLLLVSCEAKNTLPDPVIEQLQSPIETPSFVSPLWPDITSTPSPVPQPPVALIPKPTPVVPTLDITSVQIEEGRSFRLVTMPRRLDGLPPPCDFQASPDGRSVAINVCHSYGGNWVYIYDTTNGQRHNSGAKMRFDSRRLIFSGATFFRGWLPDSKHILVMIGWLEIVGFETGARHGVTPWWASPDHVDVTGAALAPDGQTIVYTTIQGDGLYFIDVEGKKLGAIPSPAPHPGGRSDKLVWSPDGKWIAYTWDQGEIFGAGPLWLASASGDSVTQLSPPDAYESMIAWSPDSSRVVVTRFKDPNDLWTVYEEPSKWVSDLWIVDVEDRLWRQLTHLDGMGAWAPQWTPDGSAVLFISNLSGQPEIWMINNDGSGLRQLTFDSQMAPLAFGVLP